MLLWPVAKPGLRVIPGVKSLPIMNTGCRNSLFLSPGLVTPYILFNISLLFMVIHTPYS